MYRMSCLQAFEVEGHVYLGCHIMMSLLFMVVLLFLVCGLDRIAYKSKLIDMVECMNSCVGLLVETFDDKPLCW